MFARDHYDFTVLVGTLAGGAFYALLAAIMVKFGWNPPTWGAKRTPRAEHGVSSSAATARPRRPRRTADEPVVLDHVEARAPAAGHQAHQRHQPQGQAPLSR